MSQSMESKERERERERVNICGLVMFIQNLISILSVKSAVDD